MKTFISKFALAFALCVNLFSASAQKSNTGDALQTIMANKAIEQTIVKAMGADAPLRLDQKADLPQYTNDVSGFKPIMIKSLADVDRALPPGDYSLDVMFYCTQWSIHRPGAGLPYKLGRAQGRLAKQMTAMLYRGTLKKINPHTLNAMAWRIQGGVQLQKWSKEEQKLVHELIPEYENSLKGDFVQQIEDNYNTLLKPKTKKTFDQQLLAMGSVGTELIKLRSSRTLLTNSAMKNDKLPEMLYDQNNDGTPIQLPAEKGAPPSPWMIVNPKVIARFTVQQGNMGHNLFEFRVLQDALSVETPSEKKSLFGKKKKSEEPAVNAYETISVSKIFNGAGEDEGRGLIGYSMLRAAQAPEVQPVLGENEPPIVLQGGQTSGNGNGNNGTNNGNNGTNQTNSELSNTDLCDYSAFINKATSKEDKTKREDLYLTILGILSELQEYRNQFLIDGDFINIFPTSYFHTTKTELINIKNNNYKYPIDKMMQMIAFYDAYKYNRQLWNGGNKTSVESHWLNHFEYVKTLQEDIKTNYLNNFNCCSFATALGMAIRAHVVFDLPRALRFALSNTNAPTNELKIEFDKSNAIFHTTVVNTLTDINSKYKICGGVFGFFDPNGFWAKNGCEDFDKQYSDKDVMYLRNKSWNKAISKESLMGIDGKLINQPLSDHNILKTNGSNFCNKESTSSSLKNITISQNVSQKTSSVNLDPLRSMNGKYIFETDLLTNPKTKDRLKKLTGADFNAIAQWDVASPIEVKNDMFVASACMPHNCDVSNYIIVADIKNNLFYVGVRRDEKVKTYTENKGQPPAEFTKWMSGK